MDNSAATQQNGGQNTPRTPPKRVRFAHGAFDWEGCSSPLPNPPHEVRYRQRPRERSATRLPKTQKTVSRKEFERSATTGTVGNNRPEKSQRGKVERRDRLIPRSKAIPRCSNATEGRGKIDPFRSLLDPSFSSPIKRLSGTGSALSDSADVPSVPDPQRRCPENRRSGFLGPRAHRVAILPPSSSRKTPPGPF